MIIFNILSIFLFLYLIAKSIRRMKSQSSRANRERMLVVIFVIHILVIVYLSFD